MRHLVPSTNYKGSNGRVQLNTAAICSRARLPNQMRGINKVGVIGHMQTQTSCVFVNMESRTGCFRLGCSDRREEEDEEENMLGQRQEERTEDKKVIVT